MGVIQYSVIVSHFDPSLIFVNTALTFTIRDALDCVAGRDKQASLYQGVASYHACLCESISP